jgi:hypothetical protein
VGHWRIQVDANWEITGNHWQLGWVGISACWWANTSRRSSVLAGAAAPTRRVVRSPGATLFSPNSVAGIHDLDHRCGLDDRLWMGIKKRVNLVKSGPPQISSPNSFTVFIAA